MYSLKLYILLSIRVNGGRIIGRRIPQKPWNNKADARPYVICIHACLSNINLIAVKTGCYAYQYAIQHLRLATQYNRKHATLRSYKAYCILAHCCYTHSEFSIIKDVWWPTQTSDWINFLFVQRKPNAHKSLPLHADLNIANTQKNEWTRSRYHLTEPTLHSKCAELSEVADVCQRGQSGTVTEWYSTSTYNSLPSVRNLQAICF